MRIAVLDDYQSVAGTLADWSILHPRAEVYFFNDHLADEEVLVERLRPFQVLCVMRERTALPRSVIERLPNLRLIASTGPINAAIDAKAAEEHGIEILHTGYSSMPTVELTWALILAAQRHLVAEACSLRAGAWQRTVGGDLHGRTLGLLGLGNIGSEVARVGAAFGMEVIGWSHNLTPVRAEAIGAVAVSRKELFARSDILSIHTLLSRRTRGSVDAPSLAMMKPDAWLINTSRSAIVDEAALLEVLRGKRIAGYAVDVFDVEPLPAGHPFTTLGNVLATPHLGYVTRGLYETFYRDSLRNIVGWLDRQDG